MNTAHAWVTSPIGVFVLFWFVLLPVCTYVFKKRTPEEYAKSAAREPRWFFSRWTPLWQLAGGLSIDPKTVAEAALKMLTGRVQPLAIGFVEAKTGMTNPPPRPPATPSPPSSTPPSGGSPVASIHDLPVIDMGYGGDDEPDTEKETPAAKRSVRAFYLLVAAAVLVSGCSSPPASRTAPVPLTAEQKRTVAELAYGALLQDCVRKAKAHMPDKSPASVTAAWAEADACADDVDRSGWGDAGSSLLSLDHDASAPTDGGAK